MNDKLTKQIMTILQISPILLLFNGWWILDNRQTFDNLWNYKMRAVDSMQSNHPVVFRVCQSSPLFFIGMASFVICILIFIVPEE